MNKFQLKLQLWVVLPALAAVLISLIILGISLYRLRLEEKAKPALVPHRNVAYNIKLDSLEISYSKVGNNQNLSDILSPYIEASMIDKIAKETGDVFDVRKMHSGNTFARLTAKDSTHRTLYFIYEINSIDFVVYDFRDSLRVYLDKKNVRVALKTASGSISGSLWNTFEKLDLDINLALDLSEIFAWTVDFYGLQNEDAFKVIFEEMYVDGRMIGIDRVLSASFRTGGREYYAFLLEDKGKKAYFDENGQSLQRSFLKAPLRFSRISSRFSRSRMHPILRIARPHFGVDYAAPHGTPVEALGEGRVTEAGWKGGYGRFIAIRHNSVYSSSYAHLSGYAKNIRPGSHVNQGQVIGFVGSSGLATGPHLDFRVYKNGSPVDPLHLESPPCEPVPASSMPQYKALMARWKPQLDKIKL
ncbi:MAG: peptidoglycan DD-metalloendopeptidase family protein [Bacteroidetes bacterium]|nr:peptidoglycan DD-metalloendopeptidase family protein [Bacteroidota bacterium]